MKLSPIPAFMALTQIYPLQAEVSDKQAPKVETINIAKTTPGLMPSESFATWIGKSLPDISFTDLQGKQWTLSSLKGKVVYLNVWFTGCAPCVKEIPELNAIHAKHVKNPDLVMLSLATNSSAELAEFLKSKPINFPVASVPFDLIKKIAMPTSTIAFPTHLIISRSGTLLVASTGGGSQISTDLEYSLNQGLK
jgi:thiol-disulfide isomerase/thioredoxin